VGAPHFRSWVGAATLVVVACRGQTTEPVRSAAGHPDISARQTRTQGMRVPGKDLMNGEPPAGAVNCESDLLADIDSKAESAVPSHMSSWSSWVNTRARVAGAQPYLLAATEAAASASNRQLMLLGARTEGQWWMWVVVRMWTATSSHDGSDLAVTAPPERRPRPPGGRKRAQPDAIAVGFLGRLSPVGSSLVVPVSTSVSQYSLPAAVIAGSGLLGPKPYSWLARMLT